MSRKLDAAEMLLDGASPAMVAAATGLKLSTVRYLRVRLDSPVEGDSSDGGRGLVLCRLCGCPCRDHRIGLCDAADR